MLRVNISTNFNLITASGGGARDSLLQFIADLSGQFIRRPKMRDKTAIGVYRILNNDYNNKIIDESDLYEPTTDRDKIIIKIKQWGEIISLLK